MEHERGAFKVNREIRPWRVKKGLNALRKALGRLGKAGWRPIECPPARLPHKKYLPEI
jgi:hypothetical protein